MSSGGNGMPTIYAMAHIGSIEAPVWETCPSVTQLVAPVGTLWGHVGALGLGLHNLMKPRGYLIM